MKDLSTEEILQKLKTSLDEKKPISITRYGDGEAIILNGFKDVEALKFVFKRQLGYMPSINEVEAIRDNLIESYKNCDIIGFPQGKRLLKREDYWYKALEIFAENIGPEVLYEKDITSIDVHSYMLDNNYFDELLRRTEVLNYISCRNLDEAFKKKYRNLKKVNSFIISPEIKFTSGYRGDKHYPNQFNHIRRNIRATECEGSLCLVGAGIVGKIYTNWFRDYGGVAMDVGSVFDSWAGFATRGVNRGEDVIDNKFKL